MACGIARGCMHARLAVLAGVMLTASAVVHAASDGEHAHLEHDVAQNAALVSEPQRKGAAHETVAPDDMALGVSHDQHHLGGLTTQAALRNASGSGASSAATAGACENAVSALRSAADMAALVVDASAFEVLNASFSGDTSQFARVQYEPGCHHLSSVSATAWLAMSTGNASLAGVTENLSEASSSAFGGRAQSSPGIEAIIGNAPTLDCAVLNFTLAARRAGVLELAYVFASEEYNEYVGVGFIDAFALFVDGQNLALLADGAPINIDSVNLVANNLSFVDHPPLAAYDGYTTLLHTQLVFIAQDREPLDFSLQICDAWDAAWDSALMIVGESIGVCAQNVSIVCENAETPVVLECTGNGEAQLDERSLGAARGMLCDTPVPVVRVDTYADSNLFPLGVSRAIFETALGGLNGTDLAFQKAAQCSVQVSVLDTTPPEIIRFGVMNAEGNDGPRLTGCMIEFDVVVRDACTRTWWTIDFGDGFFAAGPAPRAAEHTYLRAGIFRATLLVRDEGGLVSQAAIDVEIAGDSCSLLRGSGTLPTCTHRALDTRIAPGLESARWSSDPDRPGVHGLGVPL
ncbi:hypothetical protein FVE85_8887 [Porphyridium purpureum]|uniref:PKD domain-containing protein n=1 Tax=Porphyridium purpureum TaxID=35688 RepID=A0A5J4YRL0_PORPP|nr:hypothetical protein FVE85_8887 [Porphyridium purpureum]|eukprot:POR0518..scf296_7